MASVRLMGHRTRLGHVPTVIKHLDYGRGLLGRYTQGRAARVPEPPFPVPRP